jgi:hypothetical protein
VAGRAIIHVIGKKYNTCQIFNCRRLKATPTPMIEESYSLLSCTTKEDLGISV